MISPGRKPSFGVREPRRRLDPGRSCLISIWTSALRRSTNFGCIDSSPKCKSPNSDSRCKKQPLSPVRTVQNCSILAFFSSGSLRTKIGVFLDGAGDPKQTESYCGSAASTNRKVASNNQRGLVHGPVLPMDHLIHAGIRDHIPWPELFLSHKVLLSGNRTILRLSGTSGGKNRGLQNCGLSGRRGKSVHARALRRGPGRCTTCVRGRPVPVCPARRCGRLHRLLRGPGL